MITEKGMENMRLLVETAISGSGFRITKQGMEYTDGMMEMYIMVSLKMINLMVMGIIRVVME
jgi:hypothetical protein